MKTAILLLALGALTHDRCLAAPDPVLHVHVYNSANVDKRTLNRALKEAARILASSGVKTVWEEGDPEAPEGHFLDWSVGNNAARLQTDQRGFLVVQIIRSNTTSRPSVFGFALPSARQGVHVTVLYDRVEKLAPKALADVAKVLSTSMVHEMGHVLLGSGQHAQSGLMKAVWSNIELRRLTLQPLEFSPEESAVLRESVLRRAAMWDRDSQKQTAAIAIRQK